MNDVGIGNNWIHEIKENSYVVLEPWLLISFICSFQLVMHNDPIHVKIVLFVYGRKRTFNLLDFSFWRHSTLVNFDISMQLDNSITTFESFYRNVANPSLLTRKSLSPWLKYSSLLNEEPWTSCVAFFCFYFFFFFLAFFFPFPVLLNNANSIKQVFS